MSEWRDIETAPKDGAEVLALAGTDDTPIYWVVFWNGAALECVASGATFESLGDLRAWQPLPSPPVAS